MGMDGRPGFTAEVFDMLKAKVASDPNNYTSCCLMLDAISIKQHIDYDAAMDCMAGFVHLGDDQGLEEAKEALVLMLVGTRGYWKVPIGYFLTRGLTAQAQTQLVKAALGLVSETGLHVRALTMDGHRTNLAMCGILGCNLREGVTSFCHPQTANPVYVVFDACHMQKLMRNLLSAFRSIRLDSGNQF